RYSAVLSLAMVGAFLGWQATAGLSAATVMIYSSTVMYRAAIPRLAKIPIGGVLFLLVVCWLFAWRPIVERVPRLGASADHWTMIVAGLVVFGAATTAQLISRPNRESN
ncbi:MAG TPA: hypothetical protein VG713_14435, partial [Pirellulales bacterium]|nr:hypothetical protein [Pirellulales bacterium]